MRIIPCLSCLVDTIHDITQAQRNSSESHRVQLDVASLACVVAKIKIRGQKKLLAHTHVTELWVARLRVWDQFRSMLAVNSTLLSDDQGLKHFNAQE